MIERNLNGVGEGLQEGDYSGDCVDSVRQPKWRYRQRGYVCKMDRSREGAVDEGTKENQRSLGAALL